MPEELSVAVKLPLLWDGILRMAMSRLLRLVGSLRRSNDALFTKKK